MLATALVGDMEVLVPMAGLIDKGAELARLDKEIRTPARRSAAGGGKLSNAAFVDKAPAEVIEKGRQAEAEQAAGAVASNMRGFPACKVQACKKTFGSLFYPGTTQSLADNTAGNARGLT